jgi:hypothetical protein
MTDSNKPEYEVPLTKSDGTPLTQQEAKLVAQVMPMLDPDVAQAVASGNGAVIQAVASGATTNDQIVSAILATGGTAAGLPASIQQMVDQRQREIAEQNAASNDRVKDMTTGVLGMAMMGGMMGMAASGAEAKSSAEEKKTPLAYSELWMAAFASWDQQYQKDVSFNVEGRQQYEALLAKTGQDLESMGLTKQQYADEEWRKKRMEELEADQKQGKLSQQQEKELELLQQYNGAAYGITLWDADQKRLADERELIEKLKTDPEMQKQLETFKKQHPEMDEQEALKKFVEEKRAENDAASVARSAQYTSAENQDARNVDAANYAARQSVDAAAVAAANKPAAEDEFSDDAPSAPAVAAAAPRLSINGTPLAAAGLDKLGAPEVAANDPAAPQELAQITQKKPAVPSAGGMGA